MSAPRPKFIQARKSFLKSPMSNTETGSFVLNQLVDCYGNQIQTTNFVTKLRMTFNPGGSDEEIVSCTGFAINADGSTTINAGIVRALGAVSPYSAGAGTAYNHSAGTPVIILPDNPMLFDDILGYIDSLVLAAAVQATKTAIGYVKQTETNKNGRVKSSLVSEQSSPNMTLAISNFSITALDKFVTYLAGNTGTITAPVSNSRIDLVVYDTVNSVIAVRGGTENASPSAPTPTSGDIVLASVFHRVGSTKILEEDDSTNSYILRWFEPSIYKTGIVTSSSYNIFTDTDQSQAIQNGTVAVGESNVTTKKSLIAEAFVPTVASIRGAKLWKIADTGTFTGTVKVALQASSSGNPSGSDLASYTITNAAWLKLNAAAEFAVTFSSEYTSMTVGATYWIVITSSTSDTSNHPNLGINTAGGYASGSLKYNNSADGWVSIATSILYFKELGGKLSQIAQTDPTSGLIPSTLRPYSFVTMNNTTVSTSGTSETTLFSTQLEGGFWGLNTGIKVTLFVNFINGGATQNFKLKYNGTTLLAQGTSTSTGQPQGNLIFYVINQNSLSSQASNSSITTMTSVNNTGTGLGILTTYSTGTSAVDTSQPGLLEVTGQTSNSGGSQTLSVNTTIVEKIG